MTASPVPPPCAVRGLVFDLDGTLVDSYDAITDAINHARAAFSLPAMARADVSRHVGRGLEALIADVIGPASVEAGVRLFRERYARVFLETTHALPGVRETLGRLRSAGYRMSVASNKPARFSRPILDALGLLSWMDAVLGPDLTGTTKPEPTMLRRCLEAMGVAAREAVYVGDMELDVETASAAGVPVALVLGGSADEPTLRRTGRPVLNSIAELVDLLAGGGLVNRRGAGV